MVRCYCIFVLLLTTGFCANAQKAQQYFFKHVSTDNGLVSNNVFCTIQDKKGLWWIGTDNGLQRWDGFRFTDFHFNKWDSTSLYSDMVSKILEDRQERIWIAHPDGISIYDRKTASIKRAELRPEDTKPLPPDQINSFFEDKDGVIWIAGNITGVRFYDSASNSFLPYTRKWGTSYVHCNFILQQPSTGNFWMGKSEGGLYVYDKKNNKFFIKDHHPDDLNFLDQPFLQFPFTAFSIDNEENLWLSNWPIAKPYIPHFYRYNLQTGVYTHIDTYLGEANTIVSDEFNNVWFGGGMLSRYDRSTGSFEYIKKDEGSRYGIDFDNLWSLNKDRNSLIWCSTNNGIFVFYPGPKAVATYELDNTMIKGNSLDMSVTGFLEFDKNNLWVTTWGQGIFLYDSTFQVKKQLWEKDIPGSNMAWCSVRGKNDLVYMGWQEGGMTEYDMSTHNYRYYTPVELNHKTVRQIFCATDGNIWMGTQRGLIVAFDPKTKKFTQYFNEPIEGQPNGNIMAMRADTKGHLWVGTTANGLLEIDTKSHRIIRHIKTRGQSKKGLISQVIKDMCFVNDSTLVLACIGGVEIFNTQSEESLRFNYPGIRTNNINAVAKGPGDDLYLAGPNGLARITLHSMKLYQYGPTDGLLNNSYSPGSHYVLSNGLICFGTSRNFITINGSIESQTSKPGALISGVRIMNQAISVDSLETLQTPIELTYDRNFVAFDFACPQMLLSPDNTFLYKMEGFDDNWRVNSQYPTAEYSNLPPGKYRFLLKYRNTDGEDSDVSASIPLIIHPPFWKRTWFLILLALFIASFLYLLHRIRINKILTMEKVRVHIARDLHDDMGSTLSSINILSVMSNKTLENEPYKTKEYLARIGEYSQRMMETMDEIVWSINPLNDSMQKIVARMRELAATILEPKNIEYRFFVDDQVEHIKLDMAKRREFFLIFKEALNNMAKYAECSRAIIHITTKKNRLLMHVEDNGKGFNEAIIDDGNGLINMRKRAENMGGRLQIQSVVGQGTDITLNIPIT